MTTWSATDAIVDYALGYRLEDEDRQVAATAKMLVLDYLGVGFAAALTGDDGLVRLAELVHVDDGPATLVGLGRRASTADAALVNGYAAHLMEYDDSTLRPIGHPSVTILPALVSLAEARGISGAATLAAYLVGVEVHARLGEAQQVGWTADSQWLPIGTIGLVAAAAAAGRLIGLTREALTHAIGLAVHLSSGLSIGNGSSAKPFGAGYAARAAVTAAQLAELGFSGPQASIERSGGFAEVFLGATPETLRASLTRLGGRPHLAETGVAIKRYPSCYGTHWSVDALRSLLEEAGATEVRSVELVYPSTAGFLDDPSPRTVEQARFSLQYGLALCLVNGYPRVADFQPGVIGGPAVQHALGRVSATVHPADTPAPERWRHRVTVTSADGTRRTRTVSHPRGHPRNPMSESEIREKFVANVASLGTTRAAQVATWVEQLEGRADINEIIRAMANGEEHS
jgi:2-methylcitrate dehydratase PrpD